MSVTVHLDQAAALLEATLDAASGDRGRRDVSTSRVTRAATLTWTVPVTAGRWGARPVGLVEVRVWIGSDCGPAERGPGPNANCWSIPGRRRSGGWRSSRAGSDGREDRVAGVDGAGVEFGTVRPFVGTDRPREVNWPVSTRRGALFVTTRRAEHAVDVIVAVDVLVEIGPPGASARDLALSGASGLARSVLRHHDRVGLVAVGGRLHWLGPDLAERQFYRIADALLAVTDWFSYLDPDVDAIPYPALPAGARVVFFSPLVDPRGIGAAHRLAARGHRVTVVDVCTVEPPTSDETERLAIRLWRLERIAIRRRLEAEAVRVVGWNGTIPLDTAVGPDPRLSPPPTKLGSFHTPMAAARLASPSTRRSKQIGYPSQQ